MRNIHYLRKEKKLNWASSSDILLAQCHVLLFVVLLKILLEGAELCCSRACWPQVSTIPLG